jgi:hypothetical protein
MPRFFSKHAFLLIVVIAAIVTAVLTAAFWDYTQDDVFITYGYSRNIAEGQGFVFNPGEHVQGTTTPLYTLLMAGVYLLTPHLLHAGNLLSALFLMLACGLAISYVRAELSVYSQLAIAVMLVSSPIVYVSFGMETLLYCALLMLALWLWGRGSRGLAMLAAAALTWTRADGVVLGGVLWLVAAWEAWQSERNAAWPARVRQLPWLLGIIYGVGIVPWFGFAWAYFGTPLPNTLGAKQEIFQGVKFLQDGMGWWKAFYGNNPFSLIGFLLVGLGLWRAMLRPRLRPLALWAVLFTAGYTVLNVTAFWYYTPLVAALVILAALGGEWLARSLTARHFNRLVVMGTSLAVVGLSGILSAYSAWAYGGAPPRTITYRLVGQWIEQNTDPDSTILVGDLGIMGYYARRHAIDSPGLITPQMYYKLDSYAVAKFKPDYVVATGYWTWQQLVEQDWFQYHYIPATRLSTSGDGFSPITIYRRRLDIQAPQRAIEGLDLPLTCSIDLAPGTDIPDETRAQLVSSDGEIAVEASHPFLWGQYPETPARLAEHLQEQIALPLAVAPGSYIWEVSCGTTMKGSVEVEPIEMAPGYAEAAQQWGDFARLRGVAFPDGSDVWSGGTLSVVFHWEALETARQDYSLFVHLLNAKGQIAAQSDGYPRSGSDSTTSWKEGETIVDPWQISLPADLPEGDYTLSVGWYDWQTGDRVLMADGADAWTLPIVVHNRWPGGSGLP